MANSTKQEKLQLLQTWKRKAQQALVKELSPSGKVLQIGSGHADLGELVKSYQPTSHTVLEGEWLGELKDLGAFDTILLLESSIEDDLSLLQRLFPDDLKAVSTVAEAQLQSLEKKYSANRRQFSDAELDAFCEKAEGEQSKQLPAFFDSLYQNGNITREQLDRVQLDLSLESDITYEARPDDLVQAAAACVEHLNAGGKIGSLLVQAGSLYEDPDFFEKIITNLDLEYDERQIKVEAPEGMTGADSATAMVIVSVANA